MRDNCEKKLWLITKSQYNTQILLYIVTLSIMLFKNLL